MKNSSRFFCNSECEYFPCHKGIAEEEFNCLFCYCPLNRFEDCLGKPNFITKADGKVIKNCSNCNFPHKAENYDKIIAFLKDKLY